MPGVIRQDNLIQDPEALRNAGAGFLSDLAKMAYSEGKTFDLTPEEARDSGAGFIQDLLRMQGQEGGGGT